MKIDTRPAIARRLRLSTAGITAAVTVTCLALLAIAVAVGPSHGDIDSAISFEAPAANNIKSGFAPTLFSSSDVQPVSDTFSESASGSVVRN